MVAGRPIWEVMVVALLHSGVVPRICHIAQGRPRGVRRTGMTSLCFVGGSCDALPARGPGIFDVFSPIEPVSNAQNRDGSILRVFGHGKNQATIRHQHMALIVGGSAGVADDRRSR